MSSKICPLCFKKFKDCDCSNDELESFYQFNDEIAIYSQN